jgi:hypothetical protein
MKLIAHFILKDLHAMRWPIVLIACGLAVLLVERTMSLVGAPEPGSPMTRAILLSAMVAALGVALTAAVVQEDNLVTTTAFWRTRPVRRSRLLAAKAIFLLLATVPAILPLFVLSDTPERPGTGRIFYSEFPPVDWGHHASLAVAVALVMALVAAVTSDLKQFLWVAVLAISLYGAVAEDALLDNYARSREILWGHPRFDGALQITGVICGLGLVCLYLGGRRWSGFVFLAVGLVLGPLLAMI